jgi:hypothetical protein
MSNSSFEQIDSRRIDALGIEFKSYVHGPTGARHFHLDSADTNNAFMVAFPTLPADSTGVAHMLEHTTLCGSRKFPVRDPFFMMLRRSLNTFMNAFTSGDSTAYPFATQNRKDFDNLLAVYLDAVFFPTLDPRDFAQEGWRLDFADDADDPRLVYKGVVYNEMKGAMSAPTSQLWQELHAGIFSGTVYRHNSGGDPAHIPDLTYAALTDFHRRHYHPSHAVFMTYGNFPVAEHHANFERFALGEFGRSDETLMCPLQPRFSAPLQRTATYAVADSAELERGTHAVWAWLLGRSAVPMELLEGHLLSDFLLEHGGSPLRRMLETTPLADAPSELCGLDDSAQELVFMCGVEGTDPEHVAQLQEDVLAVLERAANAPGDASTLTGIVDRMEMAQRDVGGDGYPYGLQLMSRVLPGALYGTDPAALLDIDAGIAELRRRIAEPGYIASLVQTQLLNNPHHVCTIMVPDDHKGEQERAAERERLDAILRSSDAEQRAAIRRAAAELDARQSEPQNADVLPRVTLADVPRDLPAVAGEVNVMAACTAHEYAAATNGLLYLQLVHDLPALDPDELALLPLFCEYVTELGAGAESYLETQSRRARIGNFGAYAAARQSVSDSAALNGRFVVTAKGLQRHRDGLAENLFEVLRRVRFDDSARLQDLIAQSRVDADASITDRGHVLAMQGAARGLSRGAWLDDVWEGPDSIVTVQRADREVQADAAALARLAESFETLRGKILAAPSRIAVVAESQNIADTSGALARFAPPAVSDAASSVFELPAPAAATGLAWLANTQVNFCARAYLAVPEAHPDAPALAVLARYLSDGYLHPAIRERGGAYGGGAQYDTDSMTFRFFSYRDPRLTETLADFDRAVPWLHENGDAQRLEESILGVIRSLDNPRSPAGTALRAFYDGLDQRTPAFRKAFREAVLGTTYEQVCDVASRYLDPRGAATGVVTDAGHRTELEALELEAVKL